MFPGLMAPFPVEEKAEMIKVGRNDVAVPLHRERHGQFAVLAAVVHFSGHAENRIDEQRGSQAMPESCRISGVPRPPAARMTRSAGNHFLAAVPGQHPAGAAIFVDDPLDPVGGQQAGAIFCAWSRSRRLSHLTPCGQPSTQRPQPRQRAWSPILGTGCGSSFISRQMAKKPCVRGRHSPDGRQKRGSRGKVRRIPRPGRSPAPARPHPGAGRCRC